MQHADTPVDERGNIDIAARHALMLAQSYELIVQFVSPYDLSDPNQVAALQTLMGPDAVLPGDTGTYELVHLTASQTGKTYPVLVPEEHAPAYVVAWAAARDPELARKLVYRHGLLPHHPLPAAGRSGAES